MNRRAILAAPAALALAELASAKRKKHAKKRHHRERVAAQAAGQPKLVRDWFFTDGGGASVNYHNQVYRPRSFAPGLTAGNVTVQDAGNYAGWDLLVTGIQTGFNEWAQVRLNRDASVAMIWRGGGSPPAAYDNWTQDGTARVNNTTYPVYRRNNPVNAGEASFAGAGSGKATSLFLFAEADGNPTPAPDPWDGNVINPGAVCPQSLHDSWTAVGPNGQTYATWHPLFDDVYHCNYQHEHGVDPALVSPDWHPAFGYSGEMGEGHAGYKVFAFEHGGKTLGFVNHFGTTSPERAVCLRHHTVDWVVYDGNDKKLDIHLMADFGKSMANKEMPWGRFYTPPGCPNQADVGDSKGHKQIPAAGTNTGYEPWRYDLDATLVGRGFGVINTPDSLWWCADQQCATKVLNGPNDATNPNSGTVRFFLFSDPFKLGAVDGIDGEFCTNMEATALMSCGSPSALQQFIEPGFVFDGDTLPGGAASGHCHNRRGWVSDFYECGTAGGTKLERENAVPVGGPN